MAFELDPVKETSVSLPNAAWVFVTDVLRQMSYGNLVDAGQQGLLVAMNTQIIAANTPPPEPTPEVVPTPEA